MQEMSECTSIWRGFSCVILTDRLRESPDEGKAACCRKAAVMWQLAMHLETNGEVELSQHFVIQKQLDLGLQTECGAQRGAQRVTGHSK